MKKLKLALVGAAIVAVSASSASAADLCAALQDATEAVGSNTDLQGEGVERLHLPEADQCGTTRSLSGAVSFYCYWEYPLRAEEAQTHLMTLQDTVQQCFGVAPVQDDAPSVNHPDSHDLTHFVTTDASLAVSLKDKGALRKTLVFVRIEDLIE